MKKYLKGTVVCAFAFLCCKTQAQKSTEKTPADTMVKYYSRLAASANESDKALLEKELYKLLQSSQEKDWLMAQRFFFQLKKTAVSDSIAKADKIKFPLGQLVRNEEVKVVYDETDPVKKEAAYKAWIKKFPPEKFGTERIQYDYARNAVSTAYAKAGNVKKALEYANMIETPAWKGEGWAGPAVQLQKLGYLDEAANLFKKARDNSYKFMTTNRQDEGAGFAAMGYPGYNNSLAEILYKQKKYSEALQYVKEAYDSSKSVKGYVNANYANILIALGRDQEAFDKLDEAVKAGQAIEEMKQQIKKLYVKVKGYDGYDQYMADLNKELIAKMLKELPKQMINLPAPGFTLNDLNGKSVNLADLKGKVVVVDFWATWCGPCKASFPAMQMAVNKYKSDPDVKFLFIHTWERTDTAPTFNAKKYIDDMKYPFEVLMDLQDKQTGSNKVIESYRVSGIPTKFVIDKNGNIRFRLTGFSGGNDAAVEEVSAMIELARKAT